MSVNEADDISDLILAPLEAMRELERRRRDPTLQVRVEEFLAGDIPDYFRAGPILYLARHIATPAIGGNTHALSPTFFLMVP